MTYAFPKIDLHLHLDGSLLPETAWELALEQGVKLPADNLEDFKDFIVVSSDCRSVNEYLERFAMPLQLLQNAPSLSRAARELTELLAGQGVRYAEIRFAPQLHCDKGMTQEEAIDAVLEGVQQGMRNEPSIKIGVLLCCMSTGDANFNRAQNLETVRLTKEYLGRGVVGVDLAGYEGGCPLSDFSDVFALADEYELPRTIHAGDSQGPETVADALRMGTKRVGHGHHIFEDADLCRMAIENGVTLEVCPTSNIQCQSRESYGQHPLKQLYDMGMHVTVNTDNMILSGIDLDHEYDMCIEHMGFTEKDLVQMNIYSAEASFMPEDYRTMLVEELQDYLASAE